MPRRSPPREPPRRRRRRSAARRSVGPAAFRPLDLEDLLLFLAAGRVDVRDVTVRRALQVLDFAMRRVGADDSVALFLLDGIAGLAAEVADLDARLFHPPM